MFGIGLVRRIRSRVADSPFSRGVTQLALATLAGQAIILMAIPLLTRLYDPASFGVAGVFSSITAIFYPLSSLRYELAIPLPKPDEDAANLLVLSLLLLFPTALLVAVFTRVIGPALANLTHSPEIESYLWVVPVGLFGVGALQAVISWAVRIRDYTAVARARIAQGVGLVLVQVGGGLAFSPTVPWLVGGQLAGQSVGLVSVSRDAWARSRHLRHSVTRNRLWEMARRYKRFPQVSVVSGLVGGLALFLPSVLLAATYGLAPAGNYSVATRVVGLPMALIGLSVASVYLGEASRAVRSSPDGLERIHNRTVRGLFLFGALPTMAIGVVAPFVAPWVLGPGWSEAGLFMLLLAPSYAAALVASPVSSTLVIAEQLGREAAWDALRVVLVVASIVVPYNLGWGIHLAIATLSAVMVLTYAALLLLTYRASKHAEIPDRPGQRPPFADWTGTPPPVTDRPRRHER